MKILLAIPKTDCHSVVNYIVSHALRLDGHEVLNLGPNCDVQEIADSAAQMAPDLLLVTAQNGHALEDLKGLRRALEHQNTRPRFLWIGGRLTINGELTAMQERRLLKREGFTKVFPRTATLEDLVDEIRDISDVTNELSEPSMLGAPNAG